jgi:hypothetical protein
MIRALLLFIALVAVANLAPTAASADAISCLSVKRTTNLDYRITNSCRNAVRFVIKSTSDIRKEEYNSGYVSAAPSGSSDQSSYFNTAPVIVWACAVGQDTGCSDSTANATRDRFASTGKALKTAAQLQCEKYDGTWVNGRCKAWCEGKPPNTVVPAGGFCGGD